MPARTRASVRVTTPAADDDLLPDGHDPVALQQLRRARPALRIPLEAAPQEVDALGAQLVLARQLRRVALGDVVHDGPFVVERGPGPAARAHFEDDAPERPDVDGAMAALVEALDDFGGHVHGGPRHGFLFARDAPGTGVLRLEGLALAGDDLRGAEVDKFDDAVVVQKDVW